jgi:hypothetical protein
LIAARGMYVQLAKDSADVPLQMQEAMLMQAKIDESLTGVADPDKPGEMLGSLEKAKEQYQALASKYPDSAAGIAAKKRLEELEKNKAQIESFYAQLNELLTAPRPSSPAIQSPGPVFPSLPQLPPGLRNPDVKAPEPPAADKAGANKAPAPAATPAKPADGKANSSPAPSTPTVPTIPATPADGKPAPAVPPAAKTPESAAPKAGEGKSSPVPAPDKKQ